MPADALHGRSRSTVRPPCAIRAAAGPGVAIAAEMTALPIGTRRSATRVRRAGISASRSSRSASMLQPALRAPPRRLDATRRQHALRQAARRRTDRAAGAGPRCVRHRRGERRGRRRGQRGRRMPRGSGHHAADAAPRAARPLHRSRRPRRHPAPSAVSTSAGIVESIRRRFPGPEFRAVSMPAA